MQLSLKQTDEQTLKHKQVSALLFHVVGFLLWLSQTQTVPAGNQARQKEGGASS